jgi:hypothetical protein
MAPGSFADIFSDIVSSASPRALPTPFLPQIASAEQFVRPRLSEATATRDELGAEVSVLQITGGSASAMACLFTNPLEVGLPQSFRWFPPVAWISGAWVRVPKHSSSRPAVGL